MTWSPRFTLVTDGPSDEMLVPILEWLLKQHCPESDATVQFADPRGRGGSKGLAGKIEFALTSFPCECLFIHRDAEKEPSTRRHAEIQRAIAVFESDEALESLRPEVYIPVIPRRMSEAWLLLDEQAIRRAADNPNGTVPLDMPHTSTIERLPDPKSRLRSLLRSASDLSKRRQKALDRDICLQIARCIDFPGLRELTAFRALEDDVRLVVQARGWDAL